MRRAGRSALVVAVAVVGAMTLGGPGSGAPLGAWTGQETDGAAANSVSFVDSSGDGIGGAPDVTTVRVSNDDQAKLRFEIALANRTDLTGADFIQVYIDTDRSSSTGCNLGPIGVERSIAVRGKLEPELDGDPTLFGWQGCDSDPLVPNGAEPRATFSGGTLALEVPASSLGTPAPTAFRFAIVAQVDPIPDRKWDLAPNQFAWAFEIKVSTSAPRDRTPPRVRTLPSHGAPGGVAGLRYSVFDDSKRSREEIRVLRGDRVLSVIRTKLGSRNITKIYAARWPVPKDANANLRFCVRAWDAAGNRSAQSCSALAVR